MLFRSVMKTTWTWKGIDKDGQEIEITDGDAEQTEKESAVVEYTAATASTKCQYEAEAEPEVEEAVVSVKYENDNSTVDCEHEVIAYYTATVSGKSDRKTVVIPQLKHNYDWKLNKDWNEVDETTTGVKAVYGCLNEIPDDVWTNPGDYVIYDVTVTKDMSKAPDCEKDGEITWALDRKSVV